MLMTLALIDCVLIVFYVMDSAVIASMDAPPVWWRFLFPYVFHPFKAITFSASVVMVVAISAER